MADNVAAARMHPDTWVLDSLRIRHQNELVARTKAMERVTRVQIECALMSRPGVAGFW